ncbi:hypothetical protein [Sphingobacterium sp. UBA1498]|uniref:hypothetical protein n=1 Tax=Sphingobacterium sp. UBA1498 TaxID=1947481 RepID=UPI0025CBBC1B|nr:hypothetical protein [Sphingobacterium sp. UBA1498]
MDSWNRGQCGWNGSWAVGDEKNPIEMDEVCLSLKRYSGIERGFLEFEETG